MSKISMITEGTWNMLALGVSPDHHRSGLGRALVAAAEPMLAARDARLLIVDTSGTEAFAQARLLCRAWVCAGRRDPGLLGAGR